MQKNMTETDCKDKREGVTGFLPVLMVNRYVEACSDAQGVWVALDALCESLGLDYGQRAADLRETVSRRERLELQEPIAKTIDGRLCMSQRHMLTWFLQLERDDVKEEEWPWLDAFWEEAAQALMQAPGLQQKALDALKAIAQIAEENRKPNA